MKNKVLILTNSIGGLYSFRRELIEQLIDDEKVVTIVGPMHDRVEEFRKIGCHFIEVKIDRRGINVRKDLVLIKKYIELVRSIKPEVTLTYTIKPNIYGGIACRVLKENHIATITGLGSAIERPGFIKKIVTILYKVALRKSKAVFFQNKYNMDFFYRSKIITNNARLVPGSGVNTHFFNYEEYPNPSGNLNILFIGRLMKDKGIEEIISAAYELLNRNTNVIFHIVGRPEQEEYIRKLSLLEKEGIIKYYGEQKDVRPFIKMSHAIINPSYHEGMSNVLLEAASMGRPILASNIPGCRETFEEGISGFGFNAGNVTSLIHTLEQFSVLSYDKKIEMGKNGRKKIVSEFSRGQVIEQYLKEI